MFDFVFLLNFDFYFNDIDLLFLVWFILGREKGVLKKLKGLSSSRGSKTVLVSSFS